MDITIHNADGVLHSWSYQTLFDKIVSGEISKEQFVSILEDHRRDNLADGHDVGYQEGYDNGYTDGYDAGYDQGAHP